MRRSATDPSQPRVPSANASELVLAVVDLADLVDDGTTLELLGTQRPDYRVRTVAATTRVDPLSTETLDHFRTRLVLQTLDNDESIRLLGQPDWSDLGDGEFYLRLDAQGPVRLRGFRISTDHLNQLLQLMREAYGELSSAAWWTGTDTQNRIQPSLIRR